MKKIFLIVCLFINANLFSQNTKPETFIIIHTTMGDITTKLYNDTPKHRDNFIKLVNEGWYDNSPFHRVINDFMIQGGGHADGRQDPGYTIDAEILPNHYHKKGALAAARMGDNVNPAKKSSGCQFYIVDGQVTNESVLNAYTSKTGHKFTEGEKKMYKTVGGTPHLDGGYTVFGEVISGFDVIEKIAAVPTGPGDVPIKPVTMTIEILD